LDHHATTPLDPDVLDAMMPYLKDEFGNASSLDHTYGYNASVAVESAREHIAKLVNARSDEIVFTSGATESNNLALLGVMEKYKDKGNHIITCTTEHEVILKTAGYLESVGKNVTYVPVDETGIVDPDAVNEAITDRTVLISIMAANNEIGTIPDIARIGKIAHDNGVLFHTDAAQAVGHICMDVRVMNIDLMSFSAHKMYGPKGIGALYVRGARPRVRLTPIMHGGGQERNMRSGTLNVPAIVGFGKAADIALKTNMKFDEDIRIQAMNMLELFKNEVDGTDLNGDRNRRLAGNLNVYFPNIESKAVINSASKKIAISAGSACTTQNVEPSHVILAVGHDEERAHSSIRIGLGKYSKADETEFAAREIISAVKNISKATIW